MTEFETKLHQNLIRVRRHLHAFPELSGQEFETQKYLRKALEDEGLTDIRVIAGTGLAVDVVGTKARSNRKVLIRADIDALPIQETTDLTYASCTPGVMHACGHDAHAAMVFAAAAILNRRRDEFQGTVRLVFQPSEEAEPLGGRQVVSEGLLDDIDGAIGIHVDPYLDTGKVAVGAGPYTLGSDIFDIRVKGRAAHAAQPAEGIDAITVACSIVSEVQKIVSRETKQDSRIIISITGFKAGGAYNIIADEAILKGTLRSTDETSRRMAQRRLKEIAIGMGALFGAAVDIDITDGEPPVVNDPGMVEVLREAVRTVGTEQSVIEAPGWSAADDFGFYAEKVPSVYFRLGIRSSSQLTAYPLHHSSFCVDEEALPLGVATLVEAGRRFLSDEMSRQ